MAASSRVRDVARIELGARDYAVNSYLNNEPAVALADRPAAGLERARHVRRRAATDGGTVAELSRRASNTASSTTPRSSSRESIDSVIHTLFEAVVLVVIVVLVFLQNWRASLIPLLGDSGFAHRHVRRDGGVRLFAQHALAVRPGAGDRHRGRRCDRRRRKRRTAHRRRPRRRATAAHKAMDEVTGAVIAIAFGLSAVFVPTAFISGITGQFFRQFALTIAVVDAALGVQLADAHAGAVRDPAAAARRRRIGSAGCGTLRSAGSSACSIARSIAASNRYAATVGWLVRCIVVAVAVYGGLIGVTLYGFKTVPTGFIPGQDKGYLITAIQLPDGASLERTDAVVHEATEMHPGNAGRRATPLASPASPAPRARTARTPARSSSAPTPFEERAEQGLTADAAAGDSCSRS